MDLREYLKDQLALAYRSCLWRHSFVAVTGSVGKTTTVYLINHLLSLLGNIHTRAWSNQHSSVRKTLMRMPPWCRTCVVELSGWPKGNIAGVARFFKPTMGVVTAIGYDHYKVFRGPEGAAAEKGKLVEVLPRQGVAILNADDQWVSALRGRTKARVVTFGMAPDADIRGEDEANGWPNRFALTVVYRGERQRIQTRLVGTHWASVVLASIAVAVEHGLSLKQCAESIASFDPVFGRLSIHEPVPGVNFLLDTVKAPYWTMETAFNILASARASRRILIIGTVSDYAGAASPKYRALARDALECADQVWFVGPQAAHLEKLSRQEPRIHIAMDVRTLCTGLFKELRSGDLVLAKASQGDHLERLIIFPKSKIACWETGCIYKFHPCFTCRFRLVPADEGVRLVPPEQIGKFWVNPRSS